MTTYVIHDQTGTAVSYGTVIADPLPDGLTATELSDQDADAMRTGTGRWDPDTLTVVITGKVEPETDNSSRDQVAYLTAKVEALTATLDAAKLIDRKTIDASVESGKADEELLMKVAEVFEMKPEEARKIRDTDADRWAEMLAKAGISTK